jgi:hypothetical protein
MGIEITREDVSADDVAAFEAKLRTNLQALEALLAREGFGEGPRTIGAELELDLVDDAGRPVLKNREVLARCADPRVTLEVDRFNIELNATPQPLKGAPFTATAHDLDGALAVVRAAAAEEGARVVHIGILPTLREADLGPQALTDGVRYRALSSAVRRRRGAAVPLRIEGRGGDRVDVVTDDVTFEGANTSFQVHLRVSPRDFAAAWNAAQLATAPVLAVSGNAPLFLGRRLWDETRIALFRQSADDRVAGDDDVHPARVSFGHGFVRRSALELFNAAVHLHEPLLPLCGDEDALAVVAGGGVPHLDELRLHQGTVWTWNRAIFDHHDGGHLRIEFRALPAGPTTIDMMANAAFLIGLTLRLQRDVDALVAGLTFGHARRNFYAAARDGVDAELLWPDDSGRARPIGVAALVDALLPLAAEGLGLGGVDDDEASRLLGIVAARASSGRTGARFQVGVFEAAIARGCSVDEACESVMAAYAEASLSGAPVHAWR